ncbi:hypothetical protein PF001_g12745 [Phytophthora fragariae]|uniref:Uncharacterized protein n=2 Tax=Phytophthora fragariae TaxID=53985 RepID=A0A6A4DLC6_9STRA|nr:hypothetical protein PF001_g12745 [Phytophthora fragariae]
MDVSKMKKEYGNAAWTCGSSLSKRIGVDEDSSTDAGKPMLGERSTYEETLEKWALCDCSAVEDSRLERPREGPRAAPSYLALAPSNAQGIDIAMVLRRRGDEHRDSSEGQHECHRVAGLPTQYAEHYPHRRQEEQGHRAQTEQRDRRQDAEVAQRLDRLARRLEVLGRKNQELRHSEPQR